jgi:1,4-dihydroxy-6-naphthoate synthase
MSMIHHTVTHQPLFDEDDAFPLRVAYSPDSDDAFNFYAWEHGRISLSGVMPTFDREHIIALNRAALTDRYDLLSISSVAYPALADRYWILASGNSIGRGYGPVLVSKYYDSLSDLRGKVVAVAGIPTTGGALAMMYIKGARFVEMQYDLIADAIARGDVDAGVMIHEELLFFPEKGLRRVCDLGETWCQDTGLPLPVGLNVIRRDVGRDIASKVAEICERSLQWAMDHYDEAFAFASTFGRGCAEQHVSMFSNRDTLCLPLDARTALGVMFDRVAALGIGPRLSGFEIIDAMDAAAPHTSLRQLRSDVSRFVAQAI